MLGRNIFANLAGGVWIALLTILITPLQIKLLGIEAYGLVGLITILQIILGTCDLGLSATITQRVASDTQGSRSRSGDLINTVATVYWGMAIIIGLSLWCSASWMERHWLQASTLDTATVYFALQAIAVYLALRWPVAFYNGLLGGLQKLGIQNVIKSSVSTIRLLGGVAVLLYRPDLRIFLVWFDLSAGLELALYLLACRRALPGFRWGLRFSPQALGQVWKFSATMGLIAILSVLLTQLDRLMISKLLGLEVLGYYSLAYNTALALSLLQTAFNGAALPSFAEAYGRDLPQELLNRYEKTSRLMGFVLALPCCALIFFGHDLLAWWIDLAAAEGAARSMALLALGFFLNAMVSNSYVLAVACGKPGLPLRINLFGAVVYIPLLYMALVLAGSEGAAAAWIGLNVYYLATLYPAAQRGLLQQALLPWLCRNLLAFLVLGASTFGGMRILASTVDSSMAVWAGLVLAIIAYLIGAYFLLTQSLRSAIFAQGKRALSFL